MRIPQRFQFLPITLWDLTQSFIVKKLDEMYLNGQFTPGTKSVKYIWDMKSNNYY